MKRGLIVFLIGMLHICAYAGEGPWGFTLPTLDGSRFVDLRHTPKPALVNFWGVDCPPCIHELPALDQFAARHSTWSVWLVNTDAAALAQRFIDQHPVQSTVLRSGMNVSGLMRAAGNRTGALPFTLVIDSKQAICFRKVGALIPLDFAYMQQNCH